MEDTKTQAPTMEDTKTQTPTMEDTKKSIMKAFERDASEALKLVKAYHETIDIPDVLRKLFYTVIRNYSDERVSRITRTVLAECVDILSAENINRIFINLHLVHIPDQPANLKLILDKYGNKLTACSYSYYLQDKKVKISAPDAVRTSLLARIDQLDAKEAISAFHISCYMEWHDLLAQLLTNYSAIMPTVKEHHPTPVQMGIECCCLKNDTKAARLILNYCPQLLEILLETSTDKGSVEIVKVIIEEYKDLVKDLVPKLVNYYAWYSTPEMINLIVDHFGDLVTWNRCISMIYFCNALQKYKSLDCLLDKFRHMMYHPNEPHNSISQAPKLIRPTASA